MKTLINTIVIGAIIILLYTLVGHDVVKFYLGGKTELLETAANINKLCNEIKSCPNNPEGWQSWGTGNMFSNNNMLYLSFPHEGGAGKPRQSFKLIYRFFVPEWFEVQGGVGRELTTAWISR